MFSTRDVRFLGSGVEVDKGIDTRGVGLTWLVECAC